MKKLIPLLLSAALLGNTVACSKPADKTSSTSTTNTSNPNTTKTTNTSAITSNSKGQQASVPAGTTFDTILQEDLSTAKNRNNDRFTLRVKNSLVGGNPTLKDAQIQGHLEDVVKAAKGKKASLHLVVDDIMLKDGQAYPLDASLVNTQVETKTKGKFIQNAGIILGGAVAGHFLGNKANFKQGALAGGAAATAFVLSSPGGEVVLKKGTNVKWKLKTALNTAG
ncbi:hypothetical protein G7B40_011510 [Aetokthonos hydrillicola Thurmond2011]|jgi:hypothetical protein|uniref:Uncharacterized protein n=1 Tax=Aetokthonos hydrillicola Thurmond2011 TaxID=2712845 RepID=A0AAP5M7J9_9CYAN|nr:hypothetical protein [Aetokthonos hydrillicola]MBO3460048.1 hypothetical protein [Aetokthonos hydrillicola CCALA 1050]MBW4584646.1 hypothetical protein [Aetokthonos hydrillicola CCALA 1050]MDR9895190.1 hypothetical protein [Aetokthonos hydrillicola Thurmond2011]